MTLEIREALPEEYEAAGRITADAFVDLVGEASLGGYLDHLRDAASRAADAVLLVAVDDDGIVGTVTYVDDPGSRLAQTLMPGEVGIRSLAVAPGTQGRGVGAALMQVCLDRARAEGRSRIVLHTTEVMRNARRIYDRMGFVRDPTRDLSPVPDMLLPGFVLELS